MSKLAGLLKDVCEEKEDSNLEPELAIGRPTRTMYRQPDSVVKFNKEGDLVTFQVFKFEDDFQAANDSVAVEYMSTMKHKKQCRPISSVCWKCPDGIICSIPKISN